MLTFPILRCFRCGMTFTCSCDLALTELKMSGSVPELHQTLKSRTTFPLGSKPSTLHEPLSTPVVLSAEHCTELLVLSTTLIPYLKIPTLKGAQKLLV